MQITYKKSYLHFYRFTLLFTLLHFTSCFTSKKFITENESLLILPQLYFDQNIYTEYSVEGSSVQIHEALQMVHNYTQLLNISKNIDGESLVQIKYANHDTFQTYFITGSNANVLNFGLIKGKVVDVVLDMVLPWANGTMGIEIVRQGEVIVRTARRMAVVRVFQSIENSGNYSYTVMDLQLPSTLALKINRCLYFSIKTYYCFTNQQLLEITEIFLNKSSFSTNINISSLRSINESSNIASPTTSSSLQLSHIFQVSQPITKIVNMYRLQDNLIGLCDREIGCYNYKRINNKFVSVCHTKMINLDIIQVMRIVEVGPKLATMVVSSNNVLVLLRWGQDSIQIVDSMPLPKLSGGEVWDIIISGDNIGVKYRVQANAQSENVNQYFFQHIIINYDSIRLQYDQQNKILNSPYMFLMPKIMYMVSQRGNLQLHLINPYFLQVEYEDNSRSININAFNTGKQKVANVTFKGQLSLNQSKEINNKLPDQTIQVTIVSAHDGLVYVNQEFVPHIGNNYVYSFPLQLFTAFEGRVKQFVYKQKQIPMPSQQQTGQQKQTVISTSQDLRILSINNMLQCIKLQENGWSFRRVMTSPFNKVYIQECKPQKSLSVSDFVCQIKEIVDTLYISHIGQNIGFVTDLLMEGYRQYWGVHAERVRVKGQWKVLDIDTQNSNSLHVWHRPVYRTKTKEYSQYLLITRTQCITLISHIPHSPITLLPNKTMLITTHLKNSINFLLIRSSTDISAQKQQQMLQTQISLQHLKVKLKQQSNIISDDEIVQIQNIGSISISHEVGKLNMCYRVVVGVQYGNTTIAAVLHFRDFLLLGLGQSVRLERVVRLGHYAGYIRIYSHYLFSVNKTHILKYSMLSPNLTLMYSRLLQPLPSNPLQFIRNVGQYMLLVYVSSYRILDLDKELIGLIIDQNVFNSKIIHKHGDINDGNARPHSNSNSNADTDSNADTNSNLVVVGNAGVYDMILFGVDVLLLGINNIMRAYDRNLLVNIGPYPIQLDRMVSHKQVEICAFPLGNLKKPAVQQFNLTIDYEAVQIQTRGRNVKLLRNLPFEAVNETIIIYQNMFAGPIQYYYIDDIFNGAIQLLNHIQQIEQQTLSHLFTQPSSSSTPPKTPAMTTNKINQTTSSVLKKQQYEALLRKQAGIPQNINIKNYHAVYSNGTYIMIVNLQTGAVLLNVEIGQACADSFLGYYELGLDFVLFTRSCVVHIRQFKDVEVVDVVGLWGKYIRQLEIYYQTNKGNNQNVVEMGFGDNTLLMMLFQPDPQSLDANVGYMKLFDDMKQLVMLNLEGVQFMTVAGQLLIYAISTQTLSIPYSINSHSLCISLISSMISNNSDTLDETMERRINEKQCISMESLIPISYHKSNSISYYNIQLIWHQLQSQSLTENKNRSGMMKFIMFSKYAHAFHIQYAVYLNLYLSTTPTLTSSQHYLSPISTTKQQWTVSWKFQIANCYASLSPYKAAAFIGFYINSTSYDYFLIQHHSLQSTDHELLNTTFNSSHDKQSTIAFYRHNDESNQYCRHVAGWIQTRSNQIPILLQPLSTPHQSLLITLTSSYRVQKNLTLLLNYMQPPPQRATLINSRNERSSNKYYSKLVYEDDPALKYMWIYCLIGFAAVGLVFVVLKVVSVLVDRGVIHWTNSVDEEDGVGVQVHFSVGEEEGSGAMLTQGTSNKSLDSRLLTS